MRVVVIDERLKLSDCKYCYSVGEGCLRWGVRMLV